MRLITLILVLCSLFACASQAAAAEDRFFFRVDAGAGFPFLKNLNDELSIQGNARVKPGYSLALSLGHTFDEARWSAEAYFSASFHPAFHYQNAFQNDTLDSKMQHYSYMLVARWNLRPEGKAFKPSLGAGLGYGTTNLVAGVGSLGTAEALVTGRVDSRIRENIDLSLDCSYHAGLQSKQFETQLLYTNVSDVLKTSAGTTLKDRYSSLDVRVGITVWLKPRMPQ